MEQPTGKLKFAYQTIANMETKIEAQSDRIKELEEAVQMIRDSFYHRNSLGIKTEDEIAGKQPHLWRAIYNLLNRGE